MLRAVSSIATAGLAALLLLAAAPAASAATAAAVRTDTGVASQVIGWD
ncbi:hypothetical protein ACIOJE_12400 [Kitasatospora sp. NPDC087861]